MLAPIIHGNIPIIRILELMVADILLCKETIMAEHPVIMIMALAGVRIVIMTNTMPLPVGTMIIYGLNINMTEETITGTIHMTIEVIITEVTIASTIKITVNMAILMMKITIVKTIINALTISKTKTLFSFYPNFRWLYWELASIINNK